MRIFCISASQIPSTTANSIQVMKACQALAQLGHQVRLCVPSSTPHMPSLTREQEQRENQAKPPAASRWEELALHYGVQTPFEVEWIAADRRLRRYDFSFKAVLRSLRWQADLLYVWPLQAAFFGLMLGMPVACELHGPPEGKLGPALFWLLRRMPGQKRWLPITQGLANLLEKAGGKPFRKGELLIAPNGVDLERYQNLPEPAEARAQLGFPEGFTVGYSGHLYAGRGMEVLEELAREFRQVQFLWMGGRAAEVQAWKERFEQEQIKNVTLAGFIENQRLPLYQAAAEVLLMPYERVITGSSGGNSAEYCSPMKMFEYMACERAVISSDLLVIREVMNEANCLLCPPEDAESWIDALCELTQNPEKRIRLGKQARKDVLAYTWRVRAQKALEGFPTHEGQLSSD
jgi:glycosyltransferase involved in cell wall biosynthesis